MPKKAEWPSENCPVMPPKIFHALPKPAYRKARINKCRMKSFFTKIEMTRAKAMRISALNALDD